MEAKLDAEYGRRREGEREGEEEDGGYEEGENHLFCPACSKLFKTDKA